MRKILISLLILFIAAYSFAGTVQQKHLLLLAKQKGAAPPGSGKSMFFDNDVTDATYVEEAITSNTDTYAEFWIRFSGVTVLGNEKKLYVMWFGDSGEGKSIGEVYVESHVSGDLVKMYVVGYNDDESTYSGVVLISPNAGTWYQIKCRWNQASGVDSDDGTFQCTFAGGATTGPTTLDTNTLEVDLVRLGASTAPDATVDVWFDTWKAGSSSGGSQYHTDTWDASADAGDNWDGGETNGADLTVDAGVFK